MLYRASYTFVSLSAFEESGDSKRLKDGDGKNHRFRDF